MISDTHESIEFRFHRMMMELAPEKRLKMGCSMFDTAKEIVRSSILEHNPNISARELKKAIFLRFYGQDFSTDQQRKIMDLFNTTAEAL